METIALRFSENFSPNEGTIKAHEQLINELGFVWYGKLGSAVSKKNIEKILSSKEPRILLIKSGGIERYWAYISEISTSTPPICEIPEYYRNDAQKFHCWFKVNKIVLAPKNIMSFCTVSSSNRSLSEASKYSLSPYFVITVEESTEE